VITIRWGKFIVELGFSRSTGFTTGAISMRAEISSGRKAKRHPYDWYVEEGWEWEQIAAAIGLEEAESGATIWDPAAGQGRSAEWLQSAGFYGRFVLSDIVNRVDLHRWQAFERPELISFENICFIEDELQQRGDHARLSIWCNPPFSYRKYWLGGHQMIVSEAFVRRALSLATDRVVMILPAKWLAMGKKRSRLVRIDHPPQFVLHFCERPSMPPGDMIEAMGKRAFRGGMVDFCAVVWDVRQPTQPGETRTIWLRR
jgi:hypothetical protein